MMQTPYPQFSLRAANDKPRCARRAQWRRRCGLVAGCLAASFIACQPTRPAPKADETPERQFILETLTFEERRDGQLLWHGHARRGAGDLGTNDVDGLDLVRTPQAPGEAPLHLCAKSAHLALGEGQAHFAPILAYDETGRRLEGASADYDESQKRLDAQGPILVTAPGARLEASRAALHIDAGVLCLEGPVTGRIDPDARRRETRP